MKTATSVPRWVATSNTRPKGSSPQPRAARPSSRWAELDTGRNSVIPWTAPRRAAMRRDMGATDAARAPRWRSAGWPTGVRYRAPAFRGVLFLGAAPADRETEAEDAAAVPGAPAA